MVGGTVIGGVLALLLFLGFDYPGNVEAGPLATLVGVLLGGMYVGAAWERCAWNGSPAVQLGPSCVRYLGNASSLVAHLTRRPAPAHVSPRRGLKTEPTLPSGQSPAYAYLFCARAQERFLAVCMSPMWLNAWGKFPRASLVTGSIISENRPRWLA